MSEIELYILIDYTIKMLDILLLQYKQGILTHEDFKSHTGIKLAFLTAHIEKISNPDKIDEFFSYFINNPHN